MGRAAQSNFMKKFFAALILLAAGSVATQQHVQCASSAASQADAQFAKLSQEFLAGQLAWRPQTGTTLGLHEYDGKVTDFSRVSLDAELARLKRFDQRLASLDLYYRALIAQLDGVLASSTNERIARMKTSERERREHEHARRRAELDRRRDADIVSERIAVGVLEVSHAV